MPMAVPPDPSISLTVLSGVMSFASASNSYTSAGSGQQHHPFRCRCGGNAILGNKVLSVAGFGCRGGEAGTGRGRATMGKGGTAASRRKAVLPSRSCR
jgi:hypothetical protein